MKRIDSRTPSASDRSSPIRDLKVEYVPIDTIRPNPKNARRHSKEQLLLLGGSILAYGWTNPIIVDKEATVIAGHARLAAAKLKGLRKAPIVRIDNLSKAQRRAYAIADNRIAEKAQWDRSLLIEELQELQSLDVDLSGIGFDASELDLLLDDSPPADSGDVIPEADESPPLVAQRGDLFHLGDHRLLCGDATNAEDFRRLMAGKRAAMSITDPPFNVAIERNVSGLGRVRHSDFVMAAGEMSEREYSEFLESVCRNMARHSRNGSIHYICIDWRHVDALIAAGRSEFTELKNLCIWVKNNGGMGTFYRSRHELIAVFKSGTAPHINNFELGQNGRYRTNVWEYAGVNTFKKGRLDELKLHPTVKPVAMVADAIKDVSRRGDIVLDPFAGSGTALVAAERTERITYTMELDPKYVDAAVRRWQTFSGRDARHAETDLTFDELSEQRATDASIPDPESAPSRRSGGRSRPRPSQSRRRRSAR